MKHILLVTMKMQRNIYSYVSHIMHILCILLANEQCLTLNHCHIDILNDSQLFKW